MNRTVFLLSLALVLAARGASAQFTCSAVAVNGTLDPDGVALSTAFGPEVAVNGGGDALFVGRQAVPRARDRLYLFASGGNETIAVANTTSPNGKAFAVSRPFTRPSLSDPGHLAFLGKLATSSAGVGLFVRRAGDPLETAVAKDDTAPPPIVGSFQKLPGVSGVNASAQVAFIATVTDPATPSGVFLYDSVTNVSSLVVGENAAVPDQPGYEFCGFGAVGLGDSGEIVFRANIAMDCSADTPRGGIFFTAAGVPTTAVLVGDTTPLGVTTTFAKFTGNPAMVPSGNLAFAATVGGTASSDGIFLFDPGGPALTALVVRGDGMPPDVGAGSIRQIGGFALVDQSTDAACLRASITSSPAKSGIFCYDGTVAGRRTVQTQANPPPIPPFGAGAKYTKILDPDGASDGSVVGMRVDVRDTVAPRGKRGVLTCTP
jgi:hypothetical protein